MMDWLDTPPSPGDGGDRFSSPGAGTQTDASSYFAELPREAVPLFLKESWTLLPVIDACDNYELPRGPFRADVPCLSEDGIVPLFLNLQEIKQPIGFVLPRVVEALIKDNEEMEGMRMHACWELAKRKDGSIWAVGMAQWLLEEGFNGLTEHFDRMLRGWKQKGLFSSELGGWRDENYIIYGPPAPPSKDASPLPGNNAAFQIERSAAALFSFLSFGVHLTGYSIDPVTDRMTLWVPRRSKTKQTFPGMLDQTVAGGLTAGLTPFETLVKECGEEASLEPAFVEKHARAAGLISYVRRNDAGFIQPEVQYCYDLRFPLDGPQPRPNDDEVESFALMTDREALDGVLAGQFKRNCALVLLHFLIRHGRITAESDTRFLELNLRLCRSHCLPGPA